ncbi:MAG TPA: TetR/AcrR family transcriptional regulator [Spirochaetia bacterium]|nr:TetR/AcrR family transcriptional regulator [Spirochaetia bacterium]
MPRGFSEKEREVVRGRLFTEGKALFERYGLARTTVEDLTRAAGIAKGSFYRFFASKELLYMELLEREEAALKSAILDAARAEPDARAAFVAVMHQMLDYVHTDSLVGRLRESGDYAILTRAVDAERLEGHFDEDLATAESFLAVLREKGAVCDVDTRVFAGLLRGIALTALQEQQIGADVADSAMKLLVSYVADGLIGKGENK